MQVLRKVCINMEEIQAARQAQSMILAQHPEENDVMRPKIAIPKAEYSSFTYSFHLRNTQNFYVENNDEDKPYGDIILTEIGVGLVRIQYDPLLYNQLEMYFSLAL